MISRHTVAALHYTLKDDAGTTLDSSHGQEPLAYVHGTGSIIPGLENKLEGKRQGDRFHVRIPAEDAYGERDEEMVHTVPRSSLPADLELEPGVQLQAQEGGEVRIVTVVGIDGDQVHLDGNHPLAGVALNFEVAVVSVRKATEEELSHGHVHGPGGHHH